MSCVGPAISINPPVQSRTNQDAPMPAIPDIRTLMDLAVSHASGGGTIHDLYVSAVSELCSSAEGNRGALVAARDECLRRFNGAPILSETDEVFGLAATLLDDAQSSSLCS